MLHSKIREEIKMALMAKDRLRLEVLRGLSAAFVNELVAQGLKPQDQITDELAVKVLKRAVKQRKEAAEQFKKGKREDLAEKELAELDIIKEFLPEEMSEDEIRELAKICINETGSKTKADFSKVMPCVMKKTSGNADGNLVRSIVEELLG